MATQDELLRFVERFALTLRDSGIPPMPARVFAFALADDADRYTAAQLAEALQVSPAAISGAVRYLVQTRLLSREREPGTRSDLYVLHDEDLWARMFTDRLQLLEEYEARMREGARIVGLERPGGRRLAQSADFMAFVAEELPKLVDRWHERQGRPPVGSAT